MLPNDNQSTWDPTVLEYLRAKQQADEQQKAANEKADTVAGIGLGLDVLRAGLKPARGGIVLKGTYKDPNPQILAPAEEGPYTGLNAAADAMKAGAAKNKTAAMGDFFEQQKVQDMSDSRTRQKTADERASTEFGWKQEDQARKTEQLGLEDDPNSMNSQIARDLAKKLLPSSNFDGMSATQLNSMLPSLQKMYAAEQDKWLKQAQLNAASGARADAAKAKADADAVQHNEKVEKKVTELSEKTEPVKQLLDSVGQFEQLLPNKSLDKFNPEKDDLPGVSIPGIGRVSSYSSDARQLNSAMSKVFNTELKDRSGASVSNQELERLKSEFAAGKFNTEAEMIEAMKKYRDTAKEELDRREKGYSPEVRAKYKEFGNKTSQDYATPTTPETKPKPTTVIQNGHTYTLNPQTGEYE